VSVPETRNQVLRTSRLSLTILFSLLAVSSASVGDPQGGVTAHGTLISAFGNSSGLVVVTDSMATFRDGKGRIQHKSPAQKLLRYGDRTVCAIAGLGSTDVRAAPQLNADILGIVAGYRDEIQANHIEQSISSALAGISALLRFYLENIAVINSDTGHGEVIASYDLELLLVGYDPDKTPRIGELVIKVDPRRRRDGQLGWEAHEIQNDTIKVDRELQHSTKGIDYIAIRDLESPDLIDEYSIFRTFAAAKKFNSGAELTVDQMEELQRALVNLTADVQKEVGGPKQVAVLQSGHIVRLEQPDFLPPKKPFPLIVFDNVSFSRGGLIIRGNSIKLYHSTQFNDDEPIDLSRPPNFLNLDGSVFLNCTFRNKNLWHDGGSLYIDKTSRNIDSNVSFGPDASKRPDIVNLLREIFPPLQLH